MFNDGEGIWTADIWGSKRPLNQLSRPPLPERTTERYVDSVENWKKEKRKIFPYPGGFKPTNPQYRAVCSSAVKVVDRYVEFFVVAVKLFYSVMIE